MRFLSEYDGGFFDSSGSVKQQYLAEKHIDVFEKRLTRQVNHVNMDP
ncbi:MAG TPA: hypothetical protein PLO29_06560 [Paludibacter sp.]|jgi:hypothetical protein|nr:hypothetical protein [Paludibacter sp.]